MNQHPKCSSAMTMSPKALACSNASCGLKIWKTVAGKELTDNQVLQLVGKGEVGPLKGFNSRAGKKFEARLKLNQQDGKVEFVF